MKNKILFYSITLMAMLLLFLMQAYLTYNLAISLYEKDSGKLLWKVSLIILNSTFIVNFYSFFLSKINNIVVK